MEVPVEEARGSTRGSGGRGGRLVSCTLRTTWRDFEGTMEHMPAAMGVRTEEGVTEEAAWEEAPLAARVRAVVADQEMAVAAADSAVVVVAKVAEDLAAALAVALAPAMVAALAAVALAGTMAAWEAAVGVTHRAPSRRQRLDCGQMAKGRCQCSSPQTWRRRSRCVAGRRAATPVRPARP